MTYYVEYLNTENPVVKLIQFEIELTDLFGYRTDSMLKNFEITHHIIIKQIIIYDSYSAI